MKFTSEQTEVIETFGEGLAVTAGAGAGKTTTMVEKCVELVRRRPEARFVAVSFTERSANDLKHKLSSAIPHVLKERKGGALGESKVSTIHGLCRTILMEFPDVCGLQGNESILSPLEAGKLWSETLSELWSGKLPEDLSRDLAMILKEEFRISIEDQISRLKNLSGFGILSRAEESGDPLLIQLTQLAKWLIRNFERKKRRLGVIDFSDLEKRANEVLSFEQCRRYFHKRYDLVIVDEFQDTNVVQAEIIEKFVRPDYSNLVVVGDPKQSIYRFRDADVGVFNDFCGKLPKKVSLSHNFRSVKSIIECVNTICAPLFEATDQKYEPLIAARNESDDPSLICIDEGSPRELAAFLWSERNKGVEFSEFALLLRNIRGNEVWINALKRAGIPLAVESGGFFWSDPRILELVAFLKAWHSPVNALSLATFLRAPWVGVSDRDLDSWFLPYALEKEQPNLEKIWNQFFDSGHEIARALSPLKNKKDLRPSELLMKLLVNEELESQIGLSVLGLWHRTEEMSLNGLSFIEIIEQLDELTEEKPRENLLPAPMTLGKLRILSIHGSKGLEFDRVILIDFPENKKRSTMPLLYWDKERGPYLGKRTERRERDKKSDTEALFRELETEKEVNESKRLFYVALTRAKNQLIWIRPPLKKEVELTNDDYKVDFWRAWMEKASVKWESAEFDQSSQAHSFSAAERLPLKKARPILMRRPRHSVSEWNALHQCEAKYFYKFIDESQGVEKEQTPEDCGQIEFFESPEISAAEIGTKVHHYLEKNDFEGLKEFEKELGPGFIDSNAIIGWAREHESYLQTYSELAFEISVGSEVLVGVIDRVDIIKDEGGRKKIRVFDFKVSRRHRTKKSLEKQYEVQLNLYAFAVAQIEGIEMSEIEASIVCFTPEKIIEVPTQFDARVAMKLCQNAKRIIETRAVIAAQHPFCEGCEFFNNCTFRRNEAKS